MHGLAELRVKESDRLAAVIAGLRACGVDAREEGDGLIVEGLGGPPRRRSRGRARTRSPDCDELPRPRACRPRARHGGRRRHDRDQLPGLRAADAVDRARASHDVAYQGAEGAFSHEACLRFLPGHEPVPVATFPTWSLRSRSGDAEFGMLPLANNEAGETGARELIAKARLAHSRANRSSLSECICSAFRTRRWTRSGRWSAIRSRSRNAQKRLRSSALTLKRRPTRPLRRRRFEPQPRCPRVRGGGRDIRSRPSSRATSRTAPTTRPHSPS